MNVETVQKVTEILQSCYPGDAYKLSGDIGLGFKKMLGARFRRTDDDIVILAIGKCCESYETLPSIATIAKAVREIQNRVPEYDALPPAELSYIGLEKIEKIKTAAKERWKKRDKAEKPDPNDASYYAFLDPALVQYARRKFPDITLERIDSNASEIRYNMEQGGMVDGYPMGLVVNKYTGDIYNHVFVPAEQLRRK